jgi:hypothetical protein
MLSWIPFVFIRCNSISFRGGAAIWQTTYQAAKVASRKKKKSDSGLFQELQEFKGMEAIKAKLPHKPRRGKSCFLTSHALL